MDKFEYTVHLAVCAVLNKAPQAMPENITLEDVYSVSQIHFIDSLVFCALKGFDADSGIFRKWDAKYKQAEAANAIQYIEFDRICECFEDNRVEFLPIKGFSLKECYPKSSMRRMSDIDILVKDQKKAHDCMLKLGYSSESYGIGHHNVYFLKPVMNVEIHHRLVSDKRFAEYFDALSEKAMNSTDKAQKALSPLDEFIYIIYHTYKHFSKGGCGIRSIFDIYLYFQHYRSQIDEEKLNGELEKIGLKKFYEGILSLGRVWFEDKAPSELDRMICKYVFESGVYGNTKNAQINSAAGNKGSRKTKALFKLMFPDVNYMKSAFPYVRKCVLLLPFAYIHRAVRVLFTNKKGFHKLKILLKLEKSEIDKSGEMLSKLDII